MAPRSGKPGKHARASDQRYLALAAFSVDPNPNPEAEHDGIGVSSAPLYVLGPARVPGDELGMCGDAAGERVAAVSQPPGPSACGASEGQEEAVCSGVGVVAAASDASVTLLRLDVASRRC